MKIFGMGTDIVSSKRIEKLIKKKNVIFLNKIFTKSEIQLSKKRRNYLLTLSKRFAAKEAFVKALGTGIRNGINFKDIEVINDRHGKPFINLKGKTKPIVNKKIKTNKYKIFLSLSDDSPWSVATVIITYQ